MAQQQIQPWQYWASLGFGAFTAVGGVALILFGIYFIREALASKSWPVANGEIQAVQVIRDVDRDGGKTIVRHYIRINYDYEVEGISYTGDRYSLGDGSTASKRFKERSEAIAEKNKYPLGSEIDVYYKPTEPSFAILKPGTNFGTFVPIVLGVLFLPSGIALFVFMLKYPPQ